MLISLVHLSTSFGTFEGLWVRCTELSAVMGSLCYVFLHQIMLSKFVLCISTSNIVYLTMFENRGIKVREWLEVGRNR